MKASLLIICCIIFGSLLGVGHSLWHFGQLHESNRTLFVQISEDDLQITPWYPPAEGPFPKVQADRRVYEFGAMEVEQEKSHTFRITNRGKGILRIRKVSSSCKCTRFELSTTEILPNGSAEVLLAWKPENIFRNRSFRQEAKIETNDPDQPWVVLTIQGQLRPPIMIQPDQEIVFSKLKQEKGASSKIWLYAFRELPLKVMNHRFLQPENAQFFEIEINPLTQDQLDEELASSGVLIEIKIKPGMELGYFRQTLKLQHNFENVDSIEISINGKVVSQE